MPQSEQRKAYRREWAKRRYASDPEKFRAYAKEQHKKHKGKHVDRDAAYRENNREQIRAKQKIWRDANKPALRRNNLKLVNFTPELKDEMLAFQNYKCAICEDDLNLRPSKHIHADHCHKTKTARGILCTQCNSGMGLFKDDPDRLKKAIEYLADSTAEKMSRRKA